MWVYLEYDKSDELFDFAYVSSPTENSEVHKCFNILSENL